MVVVVVVGVGADESPGREQIRARCPAYSWTPCVCVTAWKPLIAGVVLHVLPSDVWRRYVAYSQQSSWWPQSNPSSYRRGTPALQWRHNEREGVSNHQPHDSFLNRLFRRRSKKHQSSTSLSLCREFIGDRCPIQIWLSCCFFVPSTARPRCARNEKAARGSDLNRTTVTGEFPTLRASNAGNIPIRWRHHGCARTPERCDGVTYSQRSSWWPQSNPSSHRSGTPDWKWDVVRVHVLRRAVRISTRMYSYTPSLSVYIQHWRRSLMEAERVKQANPALHIKLSGVTFYRLGLTDRGVPPPKSRAHRPVSHLNIKMSSHQYRDSHY